MNFMKFSRKTKMLLWQLALAFLVILNILAYSGAYFMTHYSEPGQWGLPKPNSAKTPADIGLRYSTQRLSVKDNEWVETWLIPASGAEDKGTVLLFPGKDSSKANQLLAPAQVFHDLHYNSLLVDFRGVGGSSGHTTTLGVRESEDVALVLKEADRLQLQRPFILYGISMGSAAILTAIAQEDVKPDGIILELPFARLIDALRSRVRALHIPSFPVAELIVFWGGVQHGFNAFAHNPVTYASQVQCPTLIMHGSLDRWTTIDEIKEILRNLRGNKELILFPNTGHTLLVTVDRELWKGSVNNFLQGI
jgi:uncharacterized protein